MSKRKEHEPRDRGSVWWIAPNVASVGITVWMLFSILYVMSVAMGW